jgi:hypothetical protein
MGDRGKTLPEAGKGGVLFHDARYLPSDALEE